MPAAQQGSVKNAPGVRDHYFCFRLCVNPFRLNGNFEGWCPTENVVVHSYISTTKASRELLYSVDLLRIVLFFVWIRTEWYYLWGKLCAMDHSIEERLTVLFAVKELR